MSVCLYRQTDRQSGSLSVCLSVLLMTFKVPFIFFYLVLASAEKLKCIVDDHMPTFVRLTNWNCLYSHLIAKRLLDPHMREFMIGGASFQEKGNKFYGEYLPSHGNHGYQRLFECFKEEDEHIGHETLVRLFQEKLIAV